MSDKDLISFSKMGNCPETVYFEEKLNIYYWFPRWSSITGAVIFT
jgi:hypothetical protein